MAAVDARPHELLRLATAGSVDDGKSTLIGRLLVDSRQVLDLPEDGELDLASITDGLRAEREQGITIDVAYRFFATERRSFIIADTPGHLRYTRNMVTGASTADLAVVLIDARAGIVEQSRRHAYLASLLGIRHLVGAVNKMDLVDWDEEVYERIAGDFSRLAGQLGVRDVRTIPLSALHGDNVVDRSANTPFYDGPALLEHLETVEIAADRNFDDLRFPVQWVIRPRDGSEGRGYAGQVAGGVIRPGDEVVALPAGARTRIEAVETFDGPVEEAFPPMSVTVRLADHLDVGRGDMLAAPGDSPPTAREIEATICWMTDTPLRPGRRYALKHTTRAVRATVAHVHGLVDMDTLEERAADGDQLCLNDIGRVTLRLTAPVLADPYDRNRLTGAFILVDEFSHDTLGAGMVREAREIRPSQRSPDVTWHQGALGREERWLRTGQHGATVWFTGLPASGKSTVAVELERRLVNAGQAAYLLDGDNVRHGLSGDLGFDPAERAENVRRVAHVARLFADAGVVALVALVSPFSADRRLARELHEVAELDFVEVFVDTPLDECERRDPKGLYARARAGKIPGFTGVTAPFEPPEDPEVVVRPAEEPFERAAERLLELLQRR
jgi:bifunctional enzyme CysN/CysC